jgi:hypothetical protein
MKHKRRKEKLPQSASRITGNTRILCTAWSLNLLAFGWETVISPFYLLKLMTINLFWAPISESFAPHSYCGYIFFQLPAFDVAFNSL